MLISTYRPCPEGFVIGHLHTKHTSLVTKHWSKLQGWPRHHSYVESLISDFDTKAIYSVHDLDSPVAWIMQYPFGRLAGLYTLKEYRHKEFGTLLTIELCKAIAASGLMPEALTEVHNGPSRRITAKLGFVESPHTLYWLIQE